MLIQARDVYKVYQRGQEQVQALRGVSLDLPAGAFAVIIGPSGGGKSTLLHLLGGMDRPTRGSLKVDGLVLETASEEALNRYRRTQVGFIFQFYNLIPALSALENVALSSLAQGQTRRQALARAADILAQVGLQNRLQHKPAELSGGEQQRVAIARSIAGNARLVLADEPTGDLDAASAESVMALLTDLNHRLGVTLVVATHNPAFSRLANPLYQLNMGELSAPLS